MDNYINIDRLKKLLINLIDIYSPFGKEMDIVNFVSSYLREFDLKFVLQEVSENRHNIILLPNNKKVQTVFFGHLDTINAFDFDNYKATIDGDFIKGLGSSDMKSGCAAMIEAFTSYHEKKTNNFPAALALVVGEEVNNDGANTICEEYDFSWALIGEPTNLTACLGHYAYIEAEFKTKGTLKHASMASKDDNAIHKMLKLMLGLTDYLHKKNNKIIYNFRDFSSSNVGFVVSDKCKAYIDIHVPPKFSIEEIIFNIESYVKKNFKDNVEDIVNFSTIHSGIQLPQTGFLPELIKKSFNNLDLKYKTGLFQSDSDANVLWGYGVKPITLGPGLLSQAHTPNEKVDFRQVTSAANIYLDVLNNLNT